MKWVTYYWDILQGVSSLTIHNSHEEALKYFNSNAKRYFAIKSTFHKVKKLPASFGYAHRRFCGESLKMFENDFGKVEEVAKNENDSKLSS